MEFLDTMYRRKSTRSYTGKPPSDEEIRKILEAAYSSPVARGRFSDMHLTVVRDKKIMDAIEENQSERAGEEQHPLHGAPLLVLVSVRPAGADVHNNEYSSAAMIIHSMALAATALGLGSCDIWTAILMANGNPKIVDMYRLPEGFVTCCGIVIGETQESLPVRDVIFEKISTTYLD